MTTSCVRLCLSVLSQTLSAAGRATFTSYWWWFAYTRGAKR